MSNEDLNGSDRRSNKQGARRQDPVLARRAQFSKWAKLGNRIGYSLFGISLGSFVYGAAFTFTDAVSIIATVTLLIGSLVLMPAIILGYAVKAAEREDRERGL